jgi:hypothetical protein
MKRALITVSVGLLSGCYSWNTMMPASPLGYGGKEVTGYYGMNLSAPSTTGTVTDGPMGLHLRLGSSSERDLMIGFAFERPCDPIVNAANECPTATTPDSTVYRLEVAMQHNYFESQGFYVSQGEGFGLGLIGSPSPGSLPIALGPATWFTVGWVPLDPVEIYVSGRLSSELGAVIGVRGRYRWAVFSGELGYYVPIIFDLFDESQCGPNNFFGPARVGLSIAFGYANDTHKSSTFGPATVFQQPMSLPPPPPPPPPVSPPPPPPPVNVPTNWPTPGTPPAAVPAPATAPPAPSHPTDVPLAPPPSPPPPSSAPPSTPPIPG